MLLLTMGSSQQDRGAKSIYNYRDPTLIIEHSWHGTNADINISTNVHCSGEIIRRGCSTN